MDRATIRRNATQRINKIKAAHPTCTSHVRSNQYIRQACDPAYAWRYFKADRKARLTQEPDGSYRIRLGSGDWFVLTQEES